MNATAANGKTVLITGSGRRRVGYVIARYLAQRGYSIALHYHSSQESASRICEELQLLRIPCQAYQADVSNAKDVQRLVTAVADDFGTIDGLVTTASIWNRRPLESTTAEDLRRSFDVNTLGTFLVAQEAGRVMVQQSQGGAIVTIGDWAVERPYLDHAAYLISKGAIPALTRTLALELANRNRKVRVNCIEPGPVMFPEGTSDAEARELKDSTLLRDGNCPDMVAHAVQFLLENIFITGACLPIDGGRHMYARSDERR